MKTILSIQSQVSFGAVGNTLAIMVANAMNIDIATINTISLIAHPGNGIRAGGITHDDDMAAMLAAIPALDLWDNIGMVTTGYMARAEQARLTRDAIDAGKTITPLSVLVDPAFGDHGRHYNDTSIAHAIRDQLLPVADIITPNRFEASFLSDIDITDTTSATTAGQTLLAHYPCMSAVIITGIVQDNICMDILIRADHIRQHTAPRLSHNANGFAGGGDLFASLLSTYHMQGHDMDMAFSRTADLTARILRHLDKQEKRDITRQAIAASLKTI
jgi:pyridoxine kinase